MLILVGRMMTEHSVSERRTKPFFGERRREGSFFEISSPKIDLSELTSKNK